MFVTFVRLIVIAALAALAPALARASTDYTDIWYTPSESGWGVNFAQTGDFIFATFFIYGRSGAPVWYTGQLRRTSSGVFSGLVYATSGTWFGEPVFPPVRQEDVVPVGDATFTPASDVHGTLRYRIDTVEVTRAIQRQTTVEFSVDEFYIGGVAGTVSGNCASSTFNNIMQFNVFQTASRNVRIEFLGADSTNLGRLVCVIQGNATLYGKVLHVPDASYQCTSGLDVSAEIESLRQLDDGIEARWRADLGGGCVERGRLAGVRQQ